MAYHLQNPWGAASFRMRGNWEQAEPLVAPEQFQEHHQQAQATTTSAMVVDGTSEHQRQNASAGRNHPLPPSSPTTPAWNSITDRIVVKREDPHEERNNDSGISPGHYTSDSASPDSRRSSTANCSLSPGSATSRDSHNMQANDYDYIPYKPCDSLLDYARVDNHNRTASTTDEISQHDSMDHHTTITSDDVSSTNMKLGHEDTEVIEVSPDPLQCPLCTFSSQSRLRFTEHLASHCNTGKADVAEFTKSVMEQLTNGGSVGSPEELSRASPTQNERNSDQEFEETDEPGLRVPRVNSQGKVKTFRCKQCNFVAITKLDFWEHSRMHIKAEKLLTCPKCPFVTEYKHHLEYHLRNHFGSKPYKCDKCSYSCVNKSMLNSHLKSHSNVYQFRCADCSYATKYCHSLKLHLRKYEHKPAMVLNADGSPNPLPIIDVYGTRRGPKTKPKKESEHQDLQSPVNNGLVSNVMQSVVPPQVLPLGHQFQFNGINSMNDIAKINGFNGFNGTGPPVNGIGLPATPGLLGFPYNQIFGSFPIPNPFSIQNSDSDMNESQLERIKANFMEYAKKMNGEVNTADEYPPETYNDISVKTELINDNSNPYNRFVQNEPMPLSSKSDIKVEPSEFKVAPLDLSKSEPTVINNNNVNNNKNINPNHLEPRFVSNASSNSPKTGSGTSRRKGRAIKLDRRVIENDSDEENISNERIQHNDRFEVSPPSASPGSTGSKDSKDLKDFKDSSPSGSVSINNEFTCQYCDISFGNEVMHSVHMGYHGYQNPYTCNMCGIQCTDKVSFFLHIARSKH